METQKIADIMDGAIVKLKNLLVSPTYEQLINKHAKSIKLLEMLSECDDRIIRFKKRLNEGRSTLTPDRKSRIKKHLDITKAAKKRIEQSYINLQTNGH